MKHDSQTPPQTPEEIIAQIARLMTEAEALVAGPAAEDAGKKFVTLRDRFDELQTRVADACSAARQKVLHGVRVTDETIRSHPYESVAVALGIGVLLGAVLRSNRE